MAGFAATISDWGMSELGRFLAIFQISAEMVYNGVTEPGGPTPQITRNLVKSAIASTEAMPTINPEAQEYPDRSSESIGIIQGADLGQTVYIGFQAAYAARVNYGFVGPDSLGRLYNQTGAGYIERMQQQWPQIVTAAEAKVRGRYEAGPAPTA